MLGDFVVKVGHDRLGQIAVIKVKQGDAELDRLSEDSFLWLPQGVDKQEGWFERFVQSRIFPDRHDETTKEALKALGLYVYDPVEICKKTCGRKAEDKLFVLFE